MYKKVTLALLMMLAVLCPAFSAVPTISVGGTYGIETITRGESAVEEQITSAGIIVNSFAYFSPISNFGVKARMAVRKPLKWSAGNKTVDVTDAPICLDASIAVAYQTVINHALFLETGAGFQSSIQTNIVSANTIDLTTFYLNAFVELDYAIQPSVYLSAGLVAGYPIFTYGDIRTSSYKWDGEEGDAKGFFVAPYAAVCFTY